MQLCLPSFPDDDGDRSIENSSPVTVVESCPKNRPILGVRSCSFASPHGYLYAHSPLARLHILCNCIRRKTSTSRANQLAG